MNTPQQWLALCMTALCCLTVLNSDAQSLNSPVVVQLPTALTATTEQSLNEQGIQLLYHYGNNIYLTSSKPSQAHELTAKELRMLSASPIAQLQGNQRSTAASTRVDLVLAYTDAATQLQQVLAKADFVAEEQQVQHGNTLRGTVSSAQLAELLSNPLILNATPVSNEALEPYNMEARIGQAVTPLNSGIAGAPELNGSGIVLGIGDGGELSNHPDVGDRVVGGTDSHMSSWGNHPDMVAGIMAGAGNINPRHRGVASKAELVVERTTRIIYEAPTYLANYGMTITNNSYGPSFNCANANRYYGTAASVDNQLFDYAELMHVYAVGNSGNQTCTGSPSGYGTIPSGSQTAKNVLSVGNVDFDRVRYHNSSAGPTYDGRIKPEIVAIGRSVTSNNRQEGYSTGNGTSYSAPGVAGMLGLLSQRYQQINPGQVPDGALLKAIACNTAEDLGNAGPDYIYGFGIINGPRALRTLNQGTFVKTKLAPNQVHTQNLSVSNTTEQVNVMLYWTDKPGNTSNSVATLVNDFDLMVVSPNGDTLRPWVLDHNNPASLATRGTDTLNNIEQVTFTPTSTGNYTLVVKARTLPYGSSDFYLTWQAQEPEVMITCPFGGEKLIPGEDTYIAWSASPAQTGTWKVETRHDASNWKTVQQGIPAHKRHIIWAPAQVSGAYEVRVTNEATALSDQTNAPARMISVVEGLTSNQVCDGSVEVRWESANNAAGYRVYTFDGNRMQASDVLTDTFFYIGGLQQGERALYAVAVQAADGTMGQRSYAEQNTSDSDAPDCVSPLPVDWVSIEAAQVDGAVDIEWSVANEYDSDRYEVLRGFPAGDTLEWVLVKVVQSLGESEAIQTYSAQDDDAPEAGTVYYRVEQFDLDGASSLSDVVSVTRSVSSISLASAITLTQNPVGNFLRLRSEASHQVEASLYDISGRLLKHLNLKPGANVIQWPAHLGSGMYFLRVDDESGSGTLKLIK